MLRAGSAIALVGLALPLLAACQQEGVGEAWSSGSLPGMERADGFGPEGAPGCATTESLEGVVYCDLDWVRRSADLIESCLASGGGRACLVDGRDRCSPTRDTERALVDPCDLSDLYSCLCGGGGGACVDRCSAPWEEHVDGEPILGPGDRFLLTHVSDNLDPGDFEIALEMLTDLGLYGLLHTDVSYHQLGTALGRPDIDFFYHTGHGFVGGVATSDGLLRLSEVTIEARYTVIVTCSTLAADPRPSMGPSSQAIMGYGEVTYDLTTDPVIRDLVSEIRDGSGIAEAWFRVNTRLRLLRWRDWGLLADRWVIYVRERDGIVEYSARSGRVPVALPLASQVEVEGAPGVLAPASLLADEGAPAASLPAARIVSPAALEGALPSGALSVLSPTGLSEADAAEAAFASLEASDEGLPEGAVVDAVLPIQRQLEAGSAHETIGYLVMLAREIDGAPVRSADIEPHVALLVGDDGVSLVSRAWPDVEVEALSEREVLSTSQALRAAAPLLASRSSAGEPIVVAGVSPAYAAAEGGELVPCYEVLLRDGSRLLVDAEAGAPLR